MTPLRPALSAAADTLAHAGVASPEHDARALAAHVLGLDRPADLLLVPGWDEDDARAFADLVDRRAQRVPLQHLTGQAAFRHLVLAVGPGVFVPRPETEVVVQWALDRMGGASRPVVVDLCTGSGAIALSLAQELAGAVVHAVDSEPSALQWARRNAAARAAAGDPPVRLHAGSVPGAVPELDGEVDLVISNPPYVGTGEAHQADPEVIGHDPHSALFAGPDGLSVIRAVERDARRLLRPGGLVVVEHSDRQGRTAPEVFAGWDEVADHPDLTGRDRFVTARRPA